MLTQLQYEYIHCLSVSPDPSRRYQVQTTVYNHFLSCVARDSRTSCSKTQIQINSTVHTITQISRYRLRKISTNKCKQLYVELGLREAKQEAKQKFLRHWSMFLEHPNQKVGTSCLNQNITGAQNLIFENQKTPYKLTKSAGNKANKAEVNLSSIAPFPLADELNNMIYCPTPWDNPIYL